MSRYKMSQLPSPMRSRLRRCGSYHEYRAFGYDMVTSQSSMCLLTVRTTIGGLKPSCASAIASARERAGARSASLRIANCVEGGRNPPDREAETKSKSENGGYLILLQE
ncbi:hypothetical protein [Mesorhizobium sp.]|uniref:hypothetical protein n=1 Tax=Mesorhizobium sp. TaxID=1871066 RepID=UPI00257A44C5|nr:hypothetical protein [Mesorhizobium sp.]